MLQPFPAVSFHFRSALRDLNDKCCSFTRFALYTDRSADRCHHILDHRKTESGPLSGSFRRIEWFKDLLHGIVPDSAAGIGYLQTDHIVTFGLQPDQQFLSLRLFHSLKRVFAEIHQNVFRHPSAS